MSAREYSDMGGFGYHFFDIRFVVLHNICVWAMASIRKTKKRLKRELRARKILHGIIDDSLHGTAVKFQSEWLIATTEFELEALKSRRSFCAFKNRMERKIRKDGKWEEYVELKKQELENLKERRNEQNTYCMVRRNPLR